MKIEKKYFWYLFFIYLSLSAVFFPIFLKHSDSAIREDMIKGFLKYGDFRCTNQQLFSIQYYIYTITPNGIAYPSYLPFPSLLAIPFYLIAKYLGFKTFYGLVFLNHLITFFTLCLFFLVSTYFFSQKTAFKLTLVALTTPFLLYYQRTFFTETFILFLNLSLFYFYLKEKWQKKDLFLLSLIFIAGCFTKYVFIFSIFVFYLFVFWQKKDKRKYLFLLSFIVIFSLLGVKWYKTWRFPANTQFPSCYGLMFYLNNYFHSLKDGFAGLTISPGRGLFILNPLLILSTACFISFWRKEFGIAISFFLIYLIFYSGWFMWFGGVCFGPRFLVVSYLFLFLPLGYLWEKKLFKTKKWLVFTFLILYFLSLNVNIQSLRIDDIKYFNVFIGYLIKQAEAQHTEDNKRGFIFLGNPTSDFYDINNWEWQFSPHAHWKFPATGIPKLNRFRNEKSRKIYLAILIVSISLIIYLSILLIIDWRKD